MAEIRNIVVLGRRNAGKSSLVNLLTGQQVSIVSPVKGTTTDPVRKRMELPGIGPCNIIDTAGVDDSGDVGLLRSSRSLSEAAVADLALLLFTANSFLGYERNLAKLLEDNKVPFIIVHNQEDLDPLEEEVRLGLVGEYKCPVLRFTC
ncbi:MAG: GTP-binding protein, partial [Bacteroidales bacterium]|nr:GTP-binding protein [Bacteroidales bacterium]